MDLLRALDGSLPDHRDAVVVGEQRMSWAGLRAAAESVAARIAGAPALALDATPSLSTVVATVGALLARVPLVPVPADSGPRERGHILADSGAVLLDPVRLAPVERAPTERGPVAGGPAARGPAGAPSLPPGTALILYTSGTTGPPKGVLLSRSAIAHDLDAVAEAWQWVPGDTLVHGLPLYHVHGLVLGVLGPLRLGCRLVHTGRPTPAAYAAARGTVYFGVPTVWSRVCADPPAARELRSARLLVSGSAPLPVRVHAALRELTGQAPVERYGMTETLITLSERADGPRPAGRVGSPVRGVDARLAGDGELQVRGPVLFDGYLHRPEATAAAYTPDGWFRTGDIAEVDGDGHYRIIGRSTVDIIKTGGFRVGAGEVEQALESHPAVREAAVVGVAHPDLGQEIVAYVVADGSTPEQLIDYVASQLSVHKRPRRVVLVDHLPRNAMGKVRKQQLGAAGPAAG